MGMKNGFEMDEKFVTDLGIESNAWKDVVDSMFILRKDISIKCAKEEENTEIWDLYNITVNKASGGLNDIKTTPIPDSRIEKERENYRLAIIREIDKRARVFGLDEMIKHLVGVHINITDYGTGVRRAYQLVSGKETVAEMQGKGLAADILYVMTVEQDRLRNINEYRIKREEIPKKVFGRGKTFGEILPGAGTSTLLFNLHDIMDELKLHLINKNEEEISKIKKDLENGFNEFLSLRKELRPEPYEKILLDEPSVRNTILEAIKPRSIYDIISAHPNSLKLRNMINIDPILARDLESSIDFYIKKQGIHSYCNQAVTWQLFFDPIFGGGADQLMIFNLILNTIGYKPIPVPESKDSKYFAKNLKIKMPIFSVEKYLNVDPIMFALQELNCVKEMRSKEQSNQPYVV